MQVSGRFLHLDKSIDQASARAYTGRSRGDLSAQVRRPESPEPCSRRSLAGSIAASTARETGLSGCRCSRRSLAGSIAAARCTCPASNTGWVFPPVIGGLHCGVVYNNGTATSYEGVPAGRWRAPLRPAGQHRQRDPGHVFPVGQGGLHCGTILVTSVNVCVGVLPPEGGLHCSLVARVSATSLMTGAPAAADRRAPLRRELRIKRHPVRVGCSRRSTAGSIAAAGGSGRSRPSHRDAPAVHRRAPLRLLGPPLQGVHVRRILPPFTGGLHCGTSSVMPVMTLCIPGSCGPQQAPLCLPLSCGIRQLELSAPAAPRRAPLR